MSDSCWYQDRVAACELKGERRDVVSCIRISYIDEGDLSMAFDQHPQVGLAPMEMEPTKDTRA